MYFTRMVTMTVTRTRRPATQAQTAAAPALRRYSVATTWSRNDDNTWFSGAPSPETPEYKNDQRFIDEILGLLPEPQPEHHWEFNVNVHEVMAKQKDGTKAQETICKISLVERPDYVR